MLQQRRLSEKGAPAGPGERPEESGRLSLHLGLPASRAVGTAGSAVGAPGAAEQTRTLMERG